jgi:hypothetical protein
VKSILKSVFFKKESPPSPPVVASDPPVSSELITSDIENYYLRIIVDSLRRLLVPVDSIEVGVKRTGHGRDGLNSFAGYVRVLKWNPVVTPVLLQNMPVIDARIRKVVNASVILENTHFAGLWFQATVHTEGAPTELVGMPRTLIHQTNNMSAVTIP